MFGKILKILYPTYCSTFNVLKGQTLTKPFSHLVKLLSLWPMVVLLLLLLILLLLTLLLLLQLLRTTTSQLLISLDVTLQQTTTASKASNASNEVETRLSDVDKNEGNDAITLSLLTKVLIAWNRIRLNVRLCSKNIFPSFALLFFCHLGSNPGVTNQCSRWTGLELRIVVE